MRVLRDRVEVVDPHERARALARLDPHAFVVELGILEQGILDAEPAERRSEHALTRAMLHAAATLLGRDERAAALSWLDRAVPPDLRSIEARCPEGYLCYGIDPLAYAEAARGYAREVSRARAARCVVIGVRSIGTSLSAVVAAALGTAKRTTLRPHGASGSRRLRSDPMLEAMLREERHADVLVVDEGPGVTGETFEVVLSWILSLGFSAANVRLFPSHAGEPALAPEPRRAFLSSFRAHPPSPIDPRPARICASRGLEPGPDLSRGAWRRAIGAAELPSRTLFERTKLLARDREGRAHVLRWAGVVPSPSAMVAARLAELGACAPLEPAGEGFAITPWVDGAPRSRFRRVDRPFARSLFDYLERRAELAGTGRTYDRAPAIELLLENAREARADEPSIASAVRLIEALPEREAVMLDARLAPFEWIACDDRYVKVDAADHADGVHLPGPCDLAWDLAGATIEHDLDEAAREELVRRCARASGDSARALDAATQAFLAPYAAFALGDAVLCARVAAHEHAQRREARFYRARLLDALARAHARSPVAPVHDTRAIAR